MDVTTHADVLRRFDQMPDPRGNNAIHELADMIVIAILAVICGAEGWVRVVLFAKSKRKWLVSFPELPGGIPSHDTFGRVFSLLEPEAFEHCFSQWVAALAGDGDHGRIETRRVLVSDEIEALGKVANGWAGLASIVRVESVRDIDGVVSTEQRLYISSLKGTDAAKLGDLVRGHWSVENQLHWQLDVSFNEDQCRIRKGHGAENFSRLNRMALNLLKRDKTSKVGIRRKRLKAGWDHDYLLQIINT